LQKKPLYNCVNIKTQLAQVHGKTPFFAIAKFMQKRIAIFGSTGSIGTQALEVISDHPDLFTVEMLSAHSNATLLIQQCIKYKPSIAIISEESNYQTVKAALEPHQITVYAGENALIQAAAMDNYDVLLAAIVGFAGLKSTLAAVEQGKTVALANKETLVVAGDIVMAAAARTGAKLVPVDSEHSAIFQCLVGEGHNPIEKIILTASGGPFVGKKPNFLINVRKQHALQHPNWTMGAKITIDSATLMNKGLEMIEAKWLFDLQDNQIEVVVHQQSIIHSLVQFEDGSMKAQMGLPDMKLPIQYALAYPQRIKNNNTRFDFKNYESLSFEEADLRTFRNLQIAMAAMATGGNIPCAMNAANEVAVAAFLDNKLSFLGMSDIIENTISKINFIEKPTMQDYIACDAEAREISAALTKEFTY
jgi:1-deoxy-D-xylulose-5-phosphate reductoisomerase